VGKNCKEKKIVGVRGVRVRGPKEKRGVDLGEGVYWQTGKDRAEKGAKKKREPSDRIDRPCHMRHEKKRKNVGDNAERALPERGKRQGKGGEKRDLGYSKLKKTTSRVRGGGRERFF